MIDTSGPAKLHVDSYEIAIKVIVTVTGARFVVYAKRTVCSLRNWVSINLHLAVSSAPPHPSSPLD